MTIASPFLNFATSGLTVSYRADARPQTLEILATIDKEDPKGKLPRHIERILDLLGTGAAGGADFEPSLASARLASGPIDKSARGAKGPSYAWRLEIAAVSPYFIRTIVERLANSSLRTLSIVGSLQRDAGPLSITEANVISWLDDPTAYMGEWPDPGFSVEQEDVGRGMSLAVTLENDLTDELFELLGIYAARWGAAIMSYANLRKTERGIRTAFPEKGRKKREYLAHYGSFNFVVGPSRAVLVNMLAHFHRKVAPIKRVKLGFPA